MSDNKKYYYLKLKDNFYNTEDVKLLESMPNGYEYSSLYLKLCLLSLKGEGSLLYKNRIPYKTEMLSTITGHKTEVIEYAIPIFQQLEMLSILDNGTMFIDDMQNLIGHSSTEAERKREYRRRIKETGLVKSDKCPDKSHNISTPELKKEKELKKEIREIEKNSTVFSCQYFSVNVIDYNKYTVAYNNIDILNELNKMEIWLDSNPAKRKKNYKKFISGWLGRIKQEEKPHEWSNL